MLSKRGIERIAGILLIVLFVAFAIGILFGEAEVEIDREGVHESLQEIIDDQEFFVTSLIFFLAGSLLLLPAGAALYQVFKAHDQMLALFGFVGFLSAGLLVTVAAFLQFGAFYLARDFVDGVADADTLASTARALALISGALFLTGVKMLGVGMLPLGVLMIRTGAAPRWLGYWAVVSVILMLVSWVAYISDAAFAVPGVGAILAVLFFLALGIWLLRRGTPEAASA